MQPPDDAVFIQYKDPLRQSYLGETLQAKSDRRFRVSRRRNHDPPRPERPTISRAHTERRIGARGRDKEKTRGNELPRGSVRPANVAENRPSWPGYTTQQNLMAPRARMIRISVQSHRRKRWGSGRTRRGGRREQGNGAPPNRPRPLERASVLGRAGASSRPGYKDTRTPRRTAETRKEREVSANNLPLRVALGGRAPPHPLLGGRGRA